MIWFGVFLLCALSFVFAGMEAGLLSISPVRLRHHVKHGTRGAKRLEQLLEHPEQLLVTVLIVTNVADIVALLLATQLLVARYGRAGYWIAGLAAVPVHLFALGVLPKSLFRRFPFRALVALSGVLQFAALLLRPVVAVGGGIGRLLVSRRTTDRARLFAAREELKQVAVQSEREGSLTSTERAMIHNVVDFRRVRAREMMVPLAQCITVTPETSVADVLQLSGTSGVDRFPVIANTGQAIGLVSVFDLLFDGRDPQPLPRYMRRIITAGENEPAYRLIRRLRAARLGLAAIVDANKKLIGIATDEELIKRLVQSA
ncbi:MAG: CNNM domain-containing protein [Verrucomicrobiota bacterium]|nr:CNNM domain-containing protein [Verrucomicrobiota bacterium]